MPRKFVRTRRIFQDVLNLQVLKVNLIKICQNMTTSAIRKRLMTFIADADDKKIKGMYMIFEEEIEREQDFRLTDEHIKILDDEKEKHVAGKTKSYNWSEAKQIIRGKTKL
jgi:hypothetical protein